MCSSGTCFSSLIVKKTQIAVSAVSLPCSHYRLSTHLCMLHQPLFSKAGEKESIWRYNLCEPQKRPFYTTWGQLETVPVSKLIGVHSCSFPYLSKIRTYLVCAGLDSVCLSLGTFTKEVASSVRSRYYVV